jgi:hypothetical protein
MVSRWNNDPRDPFEREGYDWRMPVAKRDKVMPVYNPKFEEIKKHTKPDHPKKKKDYELEPDAPTVTGQYKKEDATHTELPADALEKLKMVEAHTLFDDYGLERAQEHLGTDWKIVPEKSNQHGMLIENAGGETKFVMRGTKIAMLKQPYKSLTEAYNKGMTEMNIEMTEMIARADAEGMPKVDPSRRFALMDKNSGRVTKLRDYQYATEEEALQAIKKGKMPREEGVELGVKDRATGDGRYTFIDRASGEMSYNRFNTKQEVLDYLESRGAQNRPNIEVWDATGRDDLDHSKNIERFTEDVVADYDILMGGGRSNGAYLSILEMLKGSPPGEFIGFSKGGGLAILLGNELGVPTTTYNPAVGKMAVRESIGGKHIETIKKAIRDKTVLPDDLWNSISEDAYKQERAETESQGKAPPHEVWKINGDFASVLLGLQDRFKLAFGDFKVNTLDPNIEETTVPWLDYHDLKQFRGDKTKRGRPYPELRKAIKEQIDKHNKVREMEARRAYDEHGHSSKSFAEFYNRVNEGVHRAGSITWDTPFHREWNRRGRKTTNAEEIKMKSNHGTVRPPRKIGKVTHSDDEWEAFQNDREGHHKESMELTEKVDRLSQDPMAFRQKGYADALAEGLNPVGLSKGMLTGLIGEEITKRIDPYGKAGEFGDTALSGALAGSASWILKGEMTDVPEFMIAGEVANYGGKYTSKALRAMGMGQGGSMVLGQTVGGGLGGGSAYMAKLGMSKMSEAYESLTAPAPEVEPGIEMTDIVASGEETAGEITAETAGEIAGEVAVDAGVDASIEGGAMAMGMAFAPESLGTSIVIGGIVAGATALWGWIRHKHRVKEAKKKAQEHAFEIGNSRVPTRVYDDSYKGGTKMDAVNKDQVTKFMKDQQVADMLKPYTVGDDGGLLIPDSVLKSAQQTQAEDKFIKQHMPYADLVLKMKREAVEAQETLQAPKTKVPLTEGFIGKAIPSAYAKK